MEKKKILRSTVAVLLSIATVLAYFPVTGNVYAADQNGNAGEVYYAVPGEDGEGTGFVSADDAITSDELKAGIEDQLGIQKETTQQTLKPLEQGAASLAEDDGTMRAASSNELSPEYGLAFSGTGEVPEAKQAGGDVVEAKAAGDEYDIHVDVDNTGIATLNAHMGISGVIFTDLYVDDEWVKAINRADIENETFDMKDFPVGLHTVSLNLSGGGYDGKSLAYLRVPTGIYAKPTLRQADFYTGVNYFNYYDDRNSYDYDPECEVYLDFRKGNGGWSNGYGPISCGESVQKTGLSAASTYSVRTYFGKAVEYYPPQLIDDAVEPPPEEYYITGNPTGTVSFKTGYAKTPVKSIKVKKKKQYCKKIKVRRLSSQIYYRYGYAGWGYYRKVLGTKTYKYWYTKVKVTVKMKRAPGVAGIYIGSKKVNGNKKKYTAKFTLSGKKKGKKIKVSVYSFMSPVYGGWSGKTLKKVKVK